MNVCSLSATLTPQDGSSVVFLCHDMHSDAYGAVEFVDLYSEK